MKGMNYFNGGYMKKIFQWVIFALSVVALLSACSGGGGDSGTPSSPPPPPATGTVTGKVSDNTTGGAIAGATVTDGTVTATTAADGTYTLPSAPAASRKVLTISANNYAFSSKICALTTGSTSRVDVALQPVAAAITVSSLSSPQTLTVPNSPARVALQANSLVTSSGAAPSMPVTANITPIDPSSNPQLMPGNFTTSAGGAIESYGAMEVSFRASNGASLNLGSGSAAVIRIPVPAAYQSGTPPATMPAFFYNATTGMWVEEGTLTLGGTAPNQYYEGTVLHFSYWNADQIYNTTCITGRVVDSSGNPVANARVGAQGRDYIGTSEAYTASNGTFTVNVKANSTVIVTAITSTSLSNSEVVTTGAAGSACTALTTDLTLGVTGGAGTGTAKVRLTWGTDPSDLDSHLTGPDASNPSGPRFHVYYSDRGSLTTTPYAELDVDDTTSFGPEVITISRFTTGTYRYSVHHYAGSGTIYTSPARVELTLNGSTTIYAPPNPGSTVLGDDSVWQVFELVVDGSGNVTVNPLNVYLTGVSSSEVTALPPRLTGGAKPALLGGNW
jgi:uncharacterized protein YfaP (DUF2135 family)